MSKATLIAKINADLADNTTKDITEAKMRGVLLEGVDEMYPRAFESGSISKAQLGAILPFDTAYCSTGGGEMGPFNVGILSGMVPGQILNLFFGPSSSNSYTFNIPEKWSDSNYRYANVTGITSIVVAVNKQLLITFRRILNHGGSTPHIIIEHIATY